MNQKKKNTISEIWLEIQILAMKKKKEKQRYMCILYENILIWLLHLFLYRNESVCLFFLFCFVLFFLT